MAYGLEIGIQFSCFHKGALSNRKARRHNDGEKMQDNNSRSCGPIYMVGISHVQKAAWNLVTVTPNTLFWHKLMSSLKIGNLLSDILNSWRKTTFPQQIFTKNTSYGPTTWPSKSAPLCVGNKWLRNRRSAGVWNATGDQHCWLYAFWVPHGEPVLQCPK